MLTYRLKLVLFQYLKHKQTGQCNYKLYSLGVSPGQVIEELIRYLTNRKLEAGNVVKDNEMDFWKIHTVRLIWYFPFFPL